MKGAPPRAHTHTGTATRTDTPEDERTKRHNFPGKRLYTTHGRRKKIAVEQGDAKLRTKKSDSTAAHANADCRGSSRTTNDASPPITAARKRTSAAIGKRTGVTKQRRLARTVTKSKREEHCFIGRPSAVVRDETTAQRRARAICKGSGPSLFQENASSLRRCTAQ